MKIFSLLALVFALKPGVHGANFRCLSESVRMFTRCVINECPFADEECTFVSVGEDTCQDVETTCVGITNQCCMGCGQEMSKMLNCATGDLCANSIECGGTRRGLVEEVQEAVVVKEKEEPRFLAAPATDLGGLRCLSETTASFSKCVLNKCPGADQACTGVAGDADTCDEVTGMCKVITAECCPECQESLELLLDCATADLCPAFDCGTGSSTVEGGTSAGSTTVGGGSLTSAVTAAALGAAPAVLLLA